MRWSRDEARDGTVAENTSLLRVNADDLGELDPLAPSPRGGAARHIGRCVSRRSGRSMEMLHTYRLGTTNHAFARTAVCPTSALTFYLGDVDTAARGAPSDRHGLAGVGHRHSLTAIGAISFDASRSLCLELILGANPYGIDVAAMEPVDVPGTTETH